MPALVGAAPTRSAVVCSRMPGVIGWWMTTSCSACTSASLEPSYVLRALGIGEELAHSSIRFGIGRFNTDEEIDYVAGHVIESVNRLRAMSPLWEMVQEGIDLKSIQWAAEH